MSFLTTKDQSQIYFNDQGQGEPIILIHGWPLSSAMWEYQTCSLLDKGYRVIAYDRRGFGKSSQPSHGYNYDTMAEDLHELIAHLNLSKVTLIGFSMGGGEIARYLSRHGSHRVSRAVLVSSVVPYMLKTDSNPDGVDEKVFEDMIKGLRDDRPAFLGKFAKQFFGVGMVTSPVSDEMLNWAAYLAYQASPHATIECVNAFGKTDFRDDLRSFDIPTMVIHGTDDKTVPKAMGLNAAKAIPGAIFKEYSGAPHGLFITHKDQLIHDLIEFFGRTSVRHTDLTL
jgi:non-heme chloroperoxidase